MEHPLGAKGLISNDQKKEGTGNGKGYQNFWRGTYQKSVYNRRLRNQQFAVMLS